jgi:hypothetical protein
LIPRILATTICMAGSLCLDPGIVEIDWHTAHLTHGIETGDRADTCD